MKKVLVLIAILALTVSAHALTPGKITLGADTAAGNLGWVNCAALTVGYNFTDAIAASLGLNYNSYTPAGGTALSQTGIGLRVTYALPMKLSAATPVVGLQYTTDGATTSTSIISLLLGASIDIADGVDLNVGLIPYSTASRSGAGASDTSMNTGASNTVLARSIYLGLAIDLN